MRTGPAAALLVGLLGLLVLWSWTTPLMASPDEPAHVIEAAAQVRGTAATASVGNSDGVLYEARLPASLASSLALPGCFAFHPTTTADCSPPLARATTTTTAATQFGNYPQLYYDVVGLPSLLRQDAVGLWAMRALSGLACAAALAAGVLVLTGSTQSRGALWGAAVAVTPMTLFLAGVVNSSGAEVCLAFASWCAGLVLVSGEGVPRWPVAGVWALASAAYALTRPLSAPLLVVELVVLALVAGWRRLLALARSRTVLGAAAVVVVALALAALHQLTAGRSVLLGGGGGPSGTQAVRGSVGHQPRLLHEMIGVMGWLDSPVPALTVLSWLALLTGCLVVGVLTLRPRECVAVAALVVVVLALPVALEAAGAHKAGLYWQGRYTLPLAVGVPLLLTARLRPRRLPDLARRRLATVWGLALALGHGAALWCTVRRYAVGTDGPVALTAARWSPPGGLGAVLAGTVVLAVAVGMTLAAGSRQSWQSSRQSGQSLPAATP